MNNSFQDEDTPSDISGTKSPIKEERKEGIASNVSQGAGINSSFMARARQTGFDNEVIRMPKITEVDIILEYSMLIR